MTFKTSLVDIDKITSRVARATFLETDLENLAQLILQLNGIIQPLVVKETSLEKYEVVQGDFQFYGALKAWEINDDFEMIRAFIVNEQENNLVTQQLNLLHTQNTSDDSPSTINPVTKNNQTDSIGISPSIIARIANEVVAKSKPGLEGTISTIISAVFHHETNQFLQSLSTRLDQQITNIIQQQIPPRVNEPDNSSNINPNDHDFSLVTFFNTVTGERLNKLLKNSDLTSKKVQQISDFIQKERATKAFTSLDNLMERSKVNQGKRKVKLITEKTLLKIVDR